jgi:hypothetical protein
MKNSSNCCAVEVVAGAARTATERRSLGKILSRQALWTAAALRRFVSDYEYDKKRQIRYSPS